MASDRRSGPGRLLRVVERRVRPLRSIAVTVARAVTAGRMRLRLRTPVPTLVEAVEAITRRCEGAVAGPPAGSPVFLLGAGWRCGSTWVQRLLMSSGDALIWGEPFDHSGIVQTMAKQLVPIGEGWPDEEYFLGEAHPTELADRYVGTLNPPLHYLLDAHRSFYRALFEAPAHERGIPRWGFKEVRLTTAHARYLRLLFPDAKFLFLIRNPFDAYESYRKAGVWYEEWPDRLVVTPRQFGRMWARLAQDFVDNHASVGGLLVRYEDLVAEPARISAMSDYLGLALEPAAAARSIGGSGREGRTLPRFEERQLAEQVREVSRRLGYVKG